MVESSASSRAPSRSPTPVPSPQRISLSTLSVSKPTRSISSLQVQSSPSPKPPQHHMQSIPSSGVQSSASSIINVDPSEGILVPEVDAEVDIIEGDAAGAIAGFRRSPAEDEVSKKALRDQLRRTLSARESPNGQYGRRSSPSYTHTKFNPSVTPRHDCILSITPQPESSRY